ncbi:MAG: HIT domain-containing protein [Lachnospiraceae bacterium]|nr:HIT domain-containing protein [Lachnospiraceae bacterium]
MSGKQFEQCSICNEFNKKKIDDLYSLQMKEIYEACNVKSRILYEDELFWVIPSLGPVSECHLLILPKAHTYSFALLSEEQLIKAERLIKRICNIVNKVYGSSVVFEHGTLNEKMHSSASCNHAHMHVVSCDKSIIPFLEKDGLQLRRVGKLSELKEQLKRGAPYFYYSDNTLDSFIMDDTIQESQYMRILMANVLQAPEKGNWKTNFGCTEIVAMIHKMKKEFNEAQLIEEKAELVQKLNE